MPRKSDGWGAIAGQIGRATGHPCKIIDTQGLPGGSINRAVRMSVSGGSYFVKLNEPARIGMFSAEAEGLKSLAATQMLRVPGVVCVGATEESSFLVLEYLELTGGNRHTQERLGRGLAGLHRTTLTAFGWTRENTIGSTPQINTPADDWIEFWRNRRLGYQLALAARRGLHGEIERRGQQLLVRLDGFFTDYRPVPSLLHGDLWGGNRAALPDDTPVIFDPAVYYGDREADLAMTELFGGFSGDFYSAYREAWPLDEGYAVRKTLYNLYHVLNHYNLFGGGYGAQAGRMIDTLLAEL